MHKGYIAALTLFTAGQAAAFTPESGFWWNPNESGRGYSIEIQDNFLFLAAYVYDGTGVPVWFTAQGTVNVTDLNNNLAVYNGTLDRSVNGQCVGNAASCPYRRPTTTAGAGGNFRIDFHSETRATLTWAGGTTPIQRFDYALTPSGGDPRTDAMLGHWQLVLDYSSVVSSGDYPLYGDNLIFDTRSQDANEKYFDGCRSLSTLATSRKCSTAQTSSNGASGFHFTETQAGVTKDRLLIAVRDDADEFLVYYLDYGTYQLNGLVKNCPTSIPASQRYSQCILAASRPALPVRGLRTRSRSWVAGNSSAPSNADPGSKLLGQGLPSFDASTATEQNGDPVEIDGQLDWQQIPEAAFNEMMMRVERN